MTKNKKKLRRLERRDSAARAARAMLLAGMLMAGGPGAVTAMADVYDPVAGLNLNNGQRFKSGQQNFDSGAISITGSAGAQASRSGIYDLDNKTNGVYSFGLANGLGPVVTVRDGGGIEGASITVNNGTFTIEGRGDFSADTNAGKEWSWGSIVSANKDFTINGGAITVGDYGILESGKDSGGFKLKGGTVTLSGSAADKAALLRSYSVPNENGQAIEIGGGTGAAQLAVGAGKSGVVVASQVNMSDKGSIFVGSGGSLLIRQDIRSIATLADIPNTGIAGITVDQSAVLNARNIAIKGSPVSTAGTVSAEALTNVASRHIYASNLVELSDGGVINLNSASGHGLVGLDAAQDSPEIAFVATGSLNMSGGALNIGGGEGHGKGSQVQMNTVNISGGTVNLKGIIAQGTNWRDGSMLVGGMGAAAGASTKITGGTINMGAATQLVGGWSANRGNSLDIGGGVINMAGSVGSESFIRAASNGADEAGTANYAPLNISGAAQINVNGQSALLSRETNMSGGTIKIADGGRLAVAGGASGEGNLMTAIDAAAKWGSFNLSGGTLEVAQTGVMDFVTGNVAFNYSGGAINLNGGTFHVAGSEAAAPSAAPGLHVRTLAVNNDLTIDKLHVADQTGAVTVGDGAKAAKLTVTGLVSSDGQTNSGRITIKNLGTVATRFSAVGDNVNGTWAGKNNLGNVFEIRSGATLSIDASSEADSQGRVDIKNVSALKNSIAGANLLGLLEITGAAIYVPGGVVNLAEGTGLILPGVTLVDNSSNLNSSILNIGVNQITVDDLGAGNSLDLIAKDLRLMGSSSGGQLISGADGGAISTAITLLDGGVLTIGNSETPGGYAYGTLNGSVNVAEGHSGTVNIINGKFGVTGNVALGNGGSLTVSNADAAVGGKVYANRLTIANGSLAADSVAMVGDKPWLQVGDNSGPSTFTVNTLALNGGTMFVDPVWQSGVYNPSRAAVGAFAGNVIDGYVGVGMNSQLTLGSADPAWLDRNVKQLGGWGQGGITAALGIYSPQTLGSGMSLMVDGSRTINNIPAAIPNVAAFASGSLLVVNAGGLGDKPALTSQSGAAALVADSAKLRISGVKGGQIVKILNNFSTVAIDGKGWSEKGGNLSTDSYMLEAVLNPVTAGSGDNVSATVRVRNISSIYPSLDSGIAGMVTHMYNDGQNDINSNNAGIRFLSRATNRDMMPDTYYAAATMEGAAQMAVVGGVQGMTLSAANAGTNAAASRTGFASPLRDLGNGGAVHLDEGGQAVPESGLSSGGAMRSGLGMWIMPLYQNENVWRVKSGGFKTGYDGGFGGVAIGADYTVEDAFRFGASFNLGGGYAASKGSYNQTDNNFDFWGMSLYGGWTSDNFGLSADLGFTGNYSKLKQETPSAMGMGDLKADVSSSVWTWGLKAEYKIETDFVDFIPHAGLRYSGITTDSYNVKNGGRVYSVQEDNQSVWTFPVGVTLSKNIDAGGGWQFKPQVDVGVIPAAGDVKAKSRVRVPAVGGEGELKTRVVDDWTFDGTAGFEVRKDNIAFGVNYNVQASEHRTGQGVFGTFRYDF